MAQIFPLNVDDLSADEARASLAGTLAALPDPWTLLRQRRIGGDQAEPIEVVLVHPEIGVALVDEAPRDPAPAARRLRDYLDGQRFGEFFAGDLPIVTLSVAAEDFETVGEQLAAAFEAAPRLSVADADWADAVIELLMVPDDLAMAPVSDQAPSHTTEPAHALAESDFDEPDRARFDEAPDERFDQMTDEPVHERFDDTPRERFDALSSEPVRRERFDDAPRDRYSRSPSLDGDEPPLPLMVDWPFAASYQRRRRRGRIAALVVILLLLAGAGVAAWEYAGDDLTVAINDVTPRAQDRQDQDKQDNASRSIEIPLPSQSSDNQTAANPAPSAPPPVPAAPPVVMAQKPYASLPPSPPKATPVEPLPQVAEAKPTSPPPAAPPPATAPAQTAETSLPAAKPEDSAKASTPQQKEPEKTETASAPPPPPPEKPTPTAEAPHPAKSVAARSPAKPKPTRTAKAEPPPRRAEPARHEPSQASRSRPSEPSDNPPIDAADLPPLNEAPAPQRPTQLAGPNGSSQPPAGGLGPPVPLWRAQQANNNPPQQQAAAATTPASADAGNRECRPYTSSTTLTGRGLRVEGIACRGNDGQWRLVSEVPLH
jgi:hypothetical protein